MNRLDARTHNGELIGRIIFDETSDEFLFEYEKNWINSSTSYPISPSIPFDGEKSHQSSLSVRRYFENLLPEGLALDVVAKTVNLSKSNLFGLLRLIGKESSGAIVLLPHGGIVEGKNSIPRFISKAEISERINNRETVPFSVWDGKVRLSIAGYQDKIAVFVDSKKDMFLVEHPLASTHILKPVPKNSKLSSLVANEQFCMMIGASAGVKTAKTYILRVPEPVLVVNRFDRVFNTQKTSVERTHIIDGCQALNLPRSYKYEHNFGSGNDVSHIKDGVSLQKLFSMYKDAESGASFKIDMLRWTLLQYIIGNSDAHGKNISFYVGAGGKLKVAPAYDLVSTVQYEGVEDMISMGIGGEFLLSNIGAFQWADFANECGIPRRVLFSEMKRMSSKIEKVAPEIARHHMFASDEHEVIRDICSFVLNQCKTMSQDSKMVMSVVLDDDRSIEKSRKNKLKV